ncbi:hypothetical protein [Aliiroseovarius subalbicans]|uniref:hypothetical protein n=1 Tax=Aliiroseovarius subalbicans TaxID=2925840 RepID=UPI001F5A12D0|nr:hypothetical protein [Aliiroseovarius subalbicans]MCI2397973.1 hypothetical protein [Aliiroseovarius subalbicans]
MSSCSPTDSVAKADTQDTCDCGTGQARSDIACPVCRTLGMTVGHITPENTLRRQVRDRLLPDATYHFCDTPSCDVVYYNDRDSSVFGTQDLVHKVTVKDDAPDTRLCYCFKVLKQQALDDLARTGTTHVFQTIQAKMKPGQSCFCEKVNPRGDTCTKDIQDWLAQQDVASGDSAPAQESESTCCGPVPAAATGCCGGDTVQDAPKTGCC